MPAAPPDRSPPTIADRRRAVRRQPSGDAIGRRSGIHNDELACGRVVDVSTTGVGMLLDVQVEPGTLALAELARADGALVRRVLRVVRLMRLETGRYGLGAQFVRPLDAAELRVLVA
jgi:hypothetical protein